MEHLTKSLHELFASNIKPRTRVVEYFSGVELDSERWGLNQIVSTCTATIDDLGLKMATDNGSGSPSASLTFSDVKQFNSKGSSIVGNCKKGSNTNVGIKYGLADDSTVTPPNAANMGEGSLYSYKSLETNNESVTASNVALGTDWFTFKIDLRPAVCRMDLDGLLKISKTTDIPANTKLQPFLYIQSRSTAAVKQWNTNYCEAYNT
tara:strand:+ start:62 stop:682 length:621 start_codon:yes stop_codon:yes gene_type:complete